MKINLKKYLSVNAVYTNILNQSVTESIMEVNTVGKNAKVLVCETITEGLAWQSREYYSYTPIIVVEK